MNPFNLRALWKGFRGNSITFSLIFAMAIMGFSLAGIMRDSLRSVGLWWPLVFLVPMVAVGWLAKNEHQLKIRKRTRTLATILLIAGSIWCSTMLGKYEQHLREQYSDTIELGPQYQEPEREPARRGPRR